MDRIWVVPPPLSVTFPPPSSTTRWLVFATVAVAVMVIVTGSGPQLNVMTPPAATAATTAADVQLAGVPFPITWSGRRLLSMRVHGGASRGAGNRARTCGDRG